MKIVVWGGGILDNNKKPEDLKRFNKHRKQKQIIIGSIIAIIAIIGGISLYRSFAMYEEKQTFDVLKGTVPDFSTKDITLAFTIDGETTNTKFPNKGEGYIVEEVDCEDNVTADWNNGSWSLENIKTDGTAKKVKCTVKFKTIDTTSGLNGAEPVLEDGMIPVKIGDNGVVTKVDAENQDKSWYDYDAKQWANAVILTEEAQNKEYANNAEISETDIESYFVWIPKFSYQLFDENMGKYVITTGTDSEKQNKAINIRFGVINTEDVEGECKTPMLPNRVQGASGEIGHCEVGDYMTHPAFLAFDTTGLWVGKFETSKNDNSNIQIKPNQTSWRSISIKDSFEKSYNYRTSLQSHLMKNTEWGAVAYLTQSIYGRCDKEKSTCTEVTINSKSGYMTGYTNNKAYDMLDSEQLASTTGNYSGIYDMSGGAWELMASVMLNTDGTKRYSSSGLNDNVFNDPRYYDVYSYNADSTRWDRRILGDATGEMGPFATSGSDYISSMWSDYANFVFPTYPWFKRGGRNGNGTMPGVFAFERDSGGSNDYDTFRVVLAF